MKSIGIVRKVDQLGRVVIPMELRKSMDIKEGQPLEIYVDGEQIVLKKYQPGCYCCGEIKTVATVLGRDLCEECNVYFNEAIKKIEELRQKC